MLGHPGTGNGRKSFPLQGQGFTVGGQEGEQGYLNPVRVGRAEEVTPSATIEMVPKYIESREEIP